MTEYIGQNLIYGLVSYRQDFVLIVYLQEAAPQRASKYMSPMERPVWTII